MTLDKIIIDEKIQLGLNRKAVIYFIIRCY